MSGKKEFFVVILIALASFLLLFYTVNKYSVGQAVTMTSSCAEGFCQPVSLQMDLDDSLFNLQPISIGPGDSILLSNRGTTPVSGYLVLKLQKEETFYTSGTTSVNPNTPTSIRPFQEFVDYAMIINHRPVTLQPGETVHLEHAITAAEVVTGKGTFKVLASFRQGGKPALDLQGRPLAREHTFSV